MNREEEEMLQKQFETKKKNAVWSCTQDIYQKFEKKMEDERRKIASGTIVENNGKANEAAKSSVKDIEEPTASLPEPGTRNPSWPGEVLKAVLDRFGGCREGDGPSFVPSFCEKKVTKEESFSQNVETEEIRELWATISVQNNYADLLGWGGTKPIVLQRHDVSDSKDVPNKGSDFRPITCMSNLYKCKRAGTFEPGGMPRMKTSNLPRGMTLEKR
ncbi:unnamed protein product [Thelazia callipaeda]|uniref:Clathrin light chain n=1 Tax=Thelazia callipaeda TaxID=103827 RepID=A0A0N5D9X8_THECL|nr:unnamed protein product [Thelazia callipaeda]